MDRLSRHATSAAEAFSLHAEEYDHWFDDPDGRILFDAEVKAIRLLMKNLSPPFLEIGVGSGRFAKALGIGYGVEPSEALLTMARERGVNVAQAFGEKLPYADSFFGCVFILFTLCFVEDPQKVISETRRVLKGDGGVVIGLINRESPWGRSYMQKGREKDSIYQYANFFSIAEVQAMLINEGMKAEQYSSALCQPPSENLQKEETCEVLIKDAGFVCILAKKS
ncbi:MAG: class I SAM-dependent methyltransferase [Nitrospirae bacterium]|nr:class I SAM-dependent methyltransferase [Nitrospirota bacterium]